MTVRNWNREELIVAFNLYCKIPFSKINHRNKQVIELSEIINRSVSAVALKLANFARFDPDLQKRNISGMKHGSKSEKLIWDEFGENWEKLAYESETLLANFKSESIEESTEISLDYLSKEGIDKEAIIKSRVNQSFFRQMILTSYNYKCCITDISLPELLVASHIIPWSTDQSNRLNPKNGICLNALHDKAFDRGLITFSNQFKVMLSSKLKKFNDRDPINMFFVKYEGQKISLPHRFVPDKEFIDYHRNNIFIK